MIINLLELQNKTSRSVRAQRLAPLQPINTVITSVSCMRNSVIDYRISQKQAMPLNTLISPFSFHVERQNTVFKWI